MSGLEKTLTLCLMFVNPTDDIADDQGLTWSTIASLKEGKMVGKEINAANDEPEDERNTIYRNEKIEALPADYIQRS